jgi:hypothetical protein
MRRVVASVGIVALALAAGGCLWARPTYEFDNTVTITSTDDHKRGGPAAAPIATPPAEGDGAAAAAPEAATPEAAAPEAAAPEAAAPGGAASGAAAPSETAPGTPAPSDGPGPAAAWEPAEGPATETPVSAAPAATSTTLPPGVPIRKSAPWVRGSSW